MTQKFVMYSWEHSDHGFSKPEGRGRSTVPKHKLTDEDTHKPKKDQCKICVKFTRSTEEQKIAAKESYDMHVSNNKKVMGLKAMYKNKGKECKNLLVFNFDLEAVLYTPCDKVSTIFYKRKLCTYNCTTFDLVRKEGHCYIWNETEGHRGSSENVFGHLWWPKP